MPETRAQKRVLGSQMKIKSGRLKLFPRPMRKARRSHRLIWRLVLAKTHIAVDAQQRSSRWFRIGNEMWTDRPQTGTEVFNETEEGITHEFLVTTLVLLYPLEVAVKFQFAEKLE